jgi:hypothetical protein
MQPVTGMDTHSQLLLEHEKLLVKINRWRSATLWYRWLNIFVFMTCKLFVPTAALIVAVNMVSIVLDKQLIGSYTSSVIAIVVTFLASVEAMLNPGAKKRLAFTLYNELNSIENKLNIARISENNEDLKAKLIWADEEIKRLLNHYSENGY